MTAKAVLLVLAASAGAFLAETATGQDRTGPNLGTGAEAASPGGAATMALAQELFATGTLEGDAIAVLAAARLAASVEVAPTEPAALDPALVDVITEPRVLAKRKTSTDPASEPAALLAGVPRPARKMTVLAATSQADGDAVAPVSAEAMFDRARVLAGDVEALHDLIDDAMAETARGRIGGAVEWLSRLPAGQSDVWEIPFHADSFAELAIVGDGDTNLDIAVTDENGNVICYDISGSDKLYCDWSPAWDGYYYVTVQNLGAARNTYYLLTN